MRPLRAWRTDRLLSIRDLAEAADVTPKTVIDLELGRRTPMFVTMRRISEALGVPAAEIDEFAAAIDGRRGKGRP